MESTMISRNKDTHVEGLRGVCVLMVLYGHMIITGTSASLPVDPSWNPPKILEWGQFGQMAVLLFFVLSGYVIGLSYQKKWNWQVTTCYFRRRLIRLMPVNLVAVGMVWILFSWNTLPVIFGNLFFLQNDLGYGCVTIPVLSGNGNLWSLNYEVLYYFLFPLLWSQLLSLKKALIGCVFLWLMVFVFPANYMFLVCYSTGLLFWLAGLGVSRLPETVKHSTFVPWPSFVLAAMATWKLESAKMILGRLGGAVSSPLGTYVHPGQLEFLPYAFLFLALLTGRQLPGIRSLKFYCILYPLVGLAYLGFRGRYEFSGPTLFATILLIFSLLLWGFRPGFSWIQFFSPIGAISYGVYALSRPVQYWVSHHGAAFSGSFYTWSARCAFILVASAGLAWIFDYYLQQKLRAYYRPTQLH